MGQVFLGFRSLVVKFAVFVVMAALLAWALGGTLFPRPQVARSDSVAFAGSQWFWRLSVGGKNEGEIRWHLMRSQAKGDPRPAGPAVCWRESAGLQVADGSLYAAGRTDDADGDEWCIVRISADGRSSLRPVPDRLAVEQQMARLTAGLPLQDAATIVQQRGSVLDPQPHSADTEAAARAD